MAENNTKASSDNVYIPSLREFFAYCLSSWIKVIVVAVILSLLVAGGMFYKNYSSLSSDRKQYEEDYSKYEKDLDLYEAEVQLNNDQKEYLEASLISLENYIETSDFMTLDTENLSYAFVNLLIEPDYGFDVPDDLDTSDYAVVTLFNQFVTNPADVEAIAAAGGVSVNSASDMIFTEVFPDNNLLSIRCYNNDSNLAQQMLDEVLNQVYAAYESVSDSIGTVNCTIVLQYVRENQNDYAGEVSYRQNSYRNKLLSRQNEFTALNNASSEIEKPVAPVEITLNSIIKKTVAYFFIALVLCVLIYLFGCYMSFYAANSVKSYGGVSSILSGAVYAAKPFGKSKGKFKSNIVNGVAGIYAYDFFTALKRAIISVNDSESIETVYLCTSLIKESNFEEVKEDLEKISKEYNIQMKLVDDVVSDTKAMKILSRAKRVVYLSEFNKLNYDSITKVDDFFTQREIRVSYIFV